MNEPKVELILGDCKEAMAKMPPASVDAIVTDPPYGLEFMGKEWDKLEPGRERQRWKGTERKLIGQGDPGSAELFDRIDQCPTYRPNRNPQCRECGHYKFSGTPCECEEPDWDLRAGEHNLAMQEWHREWAAEAFRVLKPGGHLLVMGGARTYHRMACGVEDAGFEIRDSIDWIYGSGFPKSKNVGKAIDEAAGAERESAGRRAGAKNKTKGRAALPYRRAGWSPEFDATVPATEDAKRWDGWGTAMKPAHEPIVVARKPLDGTVAENVLEHGTGGLNVDGCRIACNDEIHVPQSDPSKREGVVGEDLGITRAGKDEFQKVQRESVERTMTKGRWPPNVLLTHHPDCEEVVVGPGEGSKAWRCVEGCPVRELDEQSGELTSGANPQRRLSPKFSGCYNDFQASAECAVHRGADSGGASRFFPCFHYFAKAARSEKEDGCEGLEGSTREDVTGRVADSPGLVNPRSGMTRRGKVTNFHPTVKPVDLMRWLVRLVTPPGGTVLDPFAGSGTTGIACHEEGFGFIGVEMDPEYFQIMEARIARARQQLRLF